MKITTKAIFSWDNESQTYKETHCDSYLYDGKIDYCQEEGASEDEAEITIDGEEVFTQAQIDAAMAAAAERLLLKRAEAVKVYLDDMYGITPGAASEIQVGEAELYKLEEEAKFPAEFNWNYFFAYGNHLSGLLADTVYPLFDPEYPSIMSQMFDPDGNYTWEYYKIRYLPFGFSEWKSDVWESESIFIKDGMSPSTLNQKDGDGNRIDPTPIEYQYDGINYRNAFYGINKITGKEENVMWGRKIPVTYVVGAKQTIVEFTERHMYIRSLMDEHNKLLKNFNRKLYDELALLDPFSFSSEMFFEANIST